MNDQLAFVLIKLFSIFLGGLIGGLLPLILIKYLKSTTIFTGLSVAGAGLLLGVALIMIIPEGFQNVIFSNLNSQNILEFEEKSLAYAGIALVCGFLFLFLIEEIIASISEQVKQRQKNSIRNPLL